MDLICYLLPGWEPLIRPASANRQWMDDTAESFAYRCLPLNIANARGWEILTPCDVTAYWTGGPRVEDVILKVKNGNADVAATIFGQGILSFHIQALFRTSPGWDLWIGGPPNQPKSGIMPLTGIVETDWSPYTFTMNWKFMRRNHQVNFIKGEPICFIFPVRRGALDDVNPRFVSVSVDSDVATEFFAWSRSRTAFQRQMADGCPRKPADKWQKRYYRGVSMSSDDPVPNHRTKVSLKPFVHNSTAAPETDRSLKAPRLRELLIDFANAIQAGENLSELKQHLTDAGIELSAFDRLIDGLGLHNPGRSIFSR